MEKCEEKKELLSKNVGIFAKIISKIVPNDVENSKINGAESKE